MNPFHKIFIALALFMLTAFAGLMLIDDAETTVNNGILESNKKTVMRVAKQIPEKFAHLDLSTLDCRFGDKQGFPAFTIPSFCYANNKEGVEVDITELVNSVAKEQSENDA